MNPYHDLLVASARASRGEWHCDQEVVIPSVLPKFDTATVAHVVVPLVSACGNNTLAFHDVLTTFARALITLSIKAIL